jgi:hypothetical protein
VDTTRLKVCNPQYLIKTLHKIIFSSMLSQRVSEIFFYKRGQKISRYDEMKMAYQKTIEHYPSLYPTLLIREKMVEIPQSQSKISKFFSKQYPQSMKKLLFWKDAPTTEKIELHTCEIKYPDSEKYIVAFLGDREVLEGKIRSFSLLAQETKTNWITFNYRGRGDSTGRAKTVDDIIRDSILQVQNLMAKGIAPNQIGLYGKCFGGAVASRVAQYFHHEGNRVHLFCDRSFSSLTNVFVGMKFGTEQDEKYEGKSFFKKMAYRILKRIVPFFVKMGLRLADWEIEAAKAFRQIPEEYKTYIQVQMPKEDRNKKNIIEDGLVDKKASLHYALKTDRKFQKDSIKKNLQTIQNEKKAWEGISIPQAKLSRLEELNRQEQGLYEALDRFREKKMYGCENPYALSVEELYRMNSKIHRMEDLKKALKIHNVLYDAILKLQDPNTPHMTNKLREQGEAELRQALLVLGTTLCGRDITENGKYRLPKDVKTYIEESMVVLYAQLEALGKEISKKENLDVHRLFDLNLEDRKISKRVPHFFDLEALYSRSKGHQKTGKDHFKQWASRIGKGEVETEQVLEKSMAKTKTPISERQKKEESQSGLGHIHRRMDFAVKDLIPRKLYQKTSWERGVRSTRDFGGIYGSMVGGGVLSSLLIAQGTPAYAAISGYTALALLGVGTSAHLAYHALGLSEVFREDEEALPILKNRISSDLLKEREVIRERVETFLKRTQISTQTRGGTIETKEGGLVLSRKGEQKGTKISFL